MKIGLGFDIHKFSKKRKLYLGGIEIPYTKGLLGHSDGDVLLHAICDGILGALGKPDIGCYFPDKDSRFKGIRSTEILKEVLKIMERERFKIKNVDIVLLCEEPKLSPFYENLRENLSNLLSIEKENIGLKAKTFEKLGEIGKGKAIACMAIVCLDKI
ncbi:MAG: 2-C-methyl-D-erythritol 2,4-cyclodiphosphate synthase [Candidatus Omnitrophota bacterium]|nr:MAG: 2-C-methyl-D-erythritol 2,4-cyclodiphosphate synthase [Candidatus Omnitrophota bacterium]